MTELSPCPVCRRHVRKIESACPFCGQALALSQMPAAVLPRTRLGRAATFAFGATLVSAATLSACGGESEGKKQGGGGTASSGAAGTSGAPQGGTSATSGAFNIYGAPPAGTGNDATGGAPAAGAGNVVPPYGAPPQGGSFDNGGNPGVPPA